MNKFKVCVTGALDIDALVTKLTAGMICDRVSERHLRIGVRVWRVMSCQKIEIDFKSSLGFSKGLHRHIAVSA